MLLLRRCAPLLPLRTCCRRRQRLRLMLMPRRYRLFADDAVTSAMLLLLRVMLPKISQR